MIDFEKLAASTTELRHQWQKAELFPHVVIDNFLPPDMAERANEAFSTPDEGWVFHNHY